MKSKIYLAEVVENTERVGMENLEYFPAHIEYADGCEAVALFTKREIIEAVKRAERNLEDIPKDTLLERIFN